MHSYIYIPWYLSWETRFARVLLVFPGQRIYICATKACSLTNSFLCFLMHTYERNILVPHISMTDAVCSSTITRKDEYQPQKHHEAGGLSSCRGKEATLVLFAGLNLDNEMASLKFMKQTQLTINQTCFISNHMFLQIVSAIITILWQTRT